jgi:hypothetical protein
MAEHGDGAAFHAWDRFPSNFTISFGNKPIE